MLKLESVHSLLLTLMSQGKDESTPWLTIMRSRPVWAIIIAHTCNNWANYTILICMPMYMKEVLKYDIKQVCIVHCACTVHCAQWTVLCALFLNLQLRYVPVQLLLYRYGIYQFEP